MVSRQKAPWLLALVLGSLAGSMAFWSIGQASETALCLSRTGPSPSFLEAISDTLDPQDCERWPHLTPIRPDNPQLVWQGNQVLMVTWTRTCNPRIAPQALSCLAEGATYQVPTRDTYALWVTAAPEVRSFILRERHYNPTFSPDHLTHRLEQYLGLKPQGVDRTFVELWVNAEDLQRPCLDPDPTDTQCDLWTVDDLEPASKFANAVGSGELADRYPFTGLGYTYDWGNPTTDVGASEFVLRDGATVTVHRQVSTQDYAK